MIKGAAFVLRSLTFAFAVSASPLISSHGLAQDNGQSALATAYEELRQQCETTSQERDRFKIQIKDLELQNKDLAAGASKCGSVSSSCSRKLLACQNQAENAGSRFNIARRQAQERAAEIVALTAKIQTLESEIAAIRGQTKQCDAEEKSLSLCEAQRSAMQERLATLQSTNDGLTRDLAEERRRAQEASTVLEEARRMAQQASSMLEAEEAKNKQLSISLETERRKVEQLRLQISRLEDRPALQCPPPPDMSGLEQCEAARTTMISPPTGPCGPIAVSVVSNEVVRVSGTVTDDQAVSSLIDQLGRVYPEKRIDRSDIKVAPNCEKKIGTGRYALLTDQSGMVRLQKFSLNRDQFNRLPFIDDCAEIGQNLASEINEFIQSVGGERFFKRFWVKDADRVVSACTRDGTGWSAASGNDIATKNSAVILLVEGADNR